MKITFVTPKADEIRLFIDFLEKMAEKQGPFKYRYKGNDLHLLITGTGIAATIYSVTKYLQHQATELLVQVGTAEAIDNNTECGSVVQIVSDRFADPGNGLQEQGDQSAGEKGERTISEPPFEDGWLHNKKTGDFLPPAIAVTTLNPELSLEQLKMLKNKHPEAGIFTAECAAFFYVGLQENIPFLSIRAISKKFEAETTQSEVEKTIKNLNAVLIEMTDSLG